MSTLGAPALDPLPLDPASLSGAGTEALARAHREGGQRLERAFWDGAPVSELVRARAWLVDHLVARLWRSCGAPPDLGLVAVGGYGRGELHPHSDVDLLVLLPEPSPGSAPGAVESFIAGAWDAGLKPGHSVRTVAQCVEAAREDVTVATNLMEARLLAGPESLYGDLVEATAAPALWPGPDFFRAKWREQQARHARFHDTAYNLEPNLKEGPGGLRDIQMVGWVARRHLGTTDLHELVQAGFLDEAEYDELVAGREYLWGIRWALHLVAGRCEDRLLFDYQRELAARFGYRDQHRQNLAVEQFMRRYYRTVMKLEVLNDLLLQHYRQTLGAGEDRREPVRLDERFQARGSYLETVRPGVFEEDPVAILEAFWLMARHPDLEGATAATLREIRAQRHRVEGLAGDARARQVFMALLRERGGVFRALNRMNRYGILGRYLPAFGRIVGHMQYDLFHVYTVDQHTLFMVRNLRRFANREYRETFPLGCRIFERLAAPELLYLAGLFHDIAKGRGGDHSTLGARDALAFCRDHGLAEGDGALVAWLVENHLLMSTTAQRRDISDPEVINRFARTVGDRRHLDHLYLLTVADIAATNPSLWNSWKDRLLTELYTATRYALRRGLESPIERREWTRRNREQAAGLLAEAGLDPERIAAVWRDFPADYFLRMTPEQIAWQTETLYSDSPIATPLVRVRRGSGEESTEVFVYAPDQDRLFATIAATLDRLALNVVEARIFTTRDGYALDTFHVLDADGRALAEGAQADEVAWELSERLSRRPLKLPRVSRVTSRRLRHFSSPTRVEFDNDERQRRTQVAIVTSDRPGLLSTVGRTLAEQHLRVHEARIATFGERVEDFFSLTDAKGVALDENRRQALKQALVDRLDSGLGHEKDMPDRRNAG